MRILRLIAALGTLLPAGHAFATTATDIPCLASSPPPNPCVVAQDVPVAGGSILDFGTRGLVVTAAGTLDAGIGNMTIRAGSLVLQPGALLVSQGGFIEVDTAAAIEVQAADTKAKVDVSGTSGGDITFGAGGDLTIAGQLLANAGVVTGDGGSIDVTGARVTIGSIAKLAAQGGDGGTGGDISVTSTQGSIALSSTIDTSGGDGGDICIDAATDFTMTASPVLNAKGLGSGSGGDIDITAGGNVSLAGQIVSSAPGGIDSGGYGADLGVDATGVITSDATINVTGGGVDGSAGYVYFDTFGDIVIRKPILASASGSAGSGGGIELDTDNAVIDIRDDLDASGLGTAGSIFAFGWGDVRVGARLTADGPNYPGPVPVPDVWLTGCTMTVTAAGQLSSQGVGGINRIQASGAMTIAGPVIATAANQLEFLDPAAPRIIFYPPSPPPVVVQNTTLIPCGGPVPTTTTTTTTVPGATSTTGTTHPVTTSSTTTSTSMSPTTSLTSSTTTSTSSRPTTTRPTAATCDPPNCDDGDGCTEDRCDPVSGCVSTARVGMDDLACRLELVATTLRSAPAEQVSARLRSRLLAKISRSEKMVAGARKLSGHRQIAKLGRAGKLLQAFIHGVQHGQDRGKLDAGLADELLGLASRADASLQLLTH
jgi:hypothetical protein